MGGGDEGSERAVKTAVKKKAMKTTVVNAVMMGVPGCSAGAVMRAGILMGAPGCSAGKKSRRIKNNILCPNQLLTVLVEIRSETRDA